MSFQGWRVEWVETGPDEGLMFVGSPDGQNLRGTPEQMLGLAALLKNAAFDALASRAVKKATSSTTS